MKIYKESPANLFIKSGQPVPYMYNKLTDYVKKHHLSANFLTDEVVISTVTKEQKELLIDKLKKFGIKFVEKRILSH